jgi:hypothetical protein
MCSGNGSGLGQDNHGTGIALGQSITGMTSGPMSHGHTSQHEAPGHGQPHMMSGLGEGSLMTWGGEGDEDGDGDFDASFGMSGVSPAFPTTDQQTPPSWRCCLRLALDGWLEFHITLADFAVHASLGQAHVL